MKMLNRWVKAHPYKAMLFAVVFALIASQAAVVSDRVFRSLVIFYALMMLLWVAIAFRDMRKLPIILALALTANSLQAAEAPQEAAPAGVFVGVVVVCVGGYCVYRVVKFCQRKFPKDTASTNSTSFMPQGDDESAASWNYGAIGSCDPTLPPPELLSSETPGTLFTVDVGTDEDGNVTMSCRAGGETQSWQEFQAEVARHGVQITGNADGSQYFSTNRVPCNPGNVAISFDAPTKTVEIGHGERLIEIERSRDLKTWTPFLRTKINRGLRVEDATTSSSMFYRVNVSRL